MKFGVKTAGAVCLTLGLGVPGLVGGAIASATSGNGSNDNVKVSTTPPAMELAASPDEQIRTTGTQGTFDGADQCHDSSSFTVECVSQSWVAAPQFKAK